MSVLFGFGAHSDIADGPELLRLTQQADRDGLDLFSLSDHPYLGARLDAYAAVGFVLGQTRHIAGLVNVTNLPTRPAPMLARTVTSLSALSGGRVVLGMGAGGLWDRISAMGVPRLSAGAAVEAFEEAIVLVKKLSGGGPPVTYRGRHYEVDEIEPARRRVTRVDRIERAEVPGRHRPCGRRLDPRPRGGLAERAVPDVTPDHRRRGGRRRP
jgi:alkanesulfonate monooxygenase SsuD/methylene tetrahydromethanopterin reductase-like flavin-dependent oxidoreductase (luciferase family)